VRKCNDIGNFWYREEIGGVIRFLGTTCVSPIATHRQLMEVSGDDVLTVQNVKKWCMELNVYRNDGDDDCGSTGRLLHAERVEELSF